MLTCSTAWVATLRLPSRIDAPVPVLSELTETIPYTTSGRTAAVAMSSTNREVIRLIRSLRQGVTSRQRHALVMMSRPGSPATSNLRDTERLVSCHARKTAGGSSFRIRKKSETPARISSSDRARRMRSSAGSAALYPELKNLLSLEYQNASAQLGDTPTISN